MLLEFRVIVSDEEPEAKRFMSRIAEQKGWTVSRDGNETVYQSHRFVLADSVDEESKAYVKEELSKRLIW